jgi:hypothetical protein
LEVRLTEALESKKVAETYAKDQERNLTSVTAEKDVVQLEEIL